MSEGQNKRVVKKNINSQKMHIKVSTEDKDMLSKNNNININLEATTKSKTKTKNTDAENMENQNKKEDINERISKLIEENEKLKVELYSIKSNIKTSAEEEISEINSLNKELSEIDKEQANLTKVNKNILGKLMNMEKEVSNRFSDKFKVSKIFLKQKKNVIKKNLDIELKSKDIQKMNTQKSINYNKKEIQKLNKLLENIEENGKLGDELKELNDQINELQKEIKELNEIKHEHNLCQKNKNILKTKLNVLANDLEFESKKSNMIKTEKKEPTKIKDVNMAMVYGKNVRNKSLQSSKNKYSSRVKIMNYKSYNFLVKEMNENKKSTDSLTIPHIDTKHHNLKTSGNVEYSNLSAYFRNQINYRIDDKTPKCFLFSDKEKEVLQKLVPNEYLNYYNEKFNTAENQITEIEDKFKQNDSIKNEILQSNYKNDALNLKIIQQNRIKADLEIDFSKNFKKISDLKRKINELNELIKKQEKLINKKDINNKKIIEKIEIKKKKKPIKE